MIPPPPGSHRPHPLLPNTTLFRSQLGALGRRRRQPQPARHHRAGRDGVAEGGIEADDPAIRLAHHELDLEDALSPQPLLGLAHQAAAEAALARSEEHTSELQSLMRISYAVFCLKKKTHTKHT